MTFLFLQDEEKAKEAKPLKEEEELQKEAKTEDEKKTDDEEVADHTYSSADLPGEAEKGAIAKPSTPTVTVEDEAE